MGTFTMPLKDVLELEPDIGLLHYEIFDEAYRGKLNQKIIDHYWNQEIGQETISMFKHALKRKMNEIMPFYNQLYASEKLKFDPMNTVDMTTFSTSESDTAGTSKSDTTSTSDAKSRAISQQFPQVALSGNGDYATAGQDNISNTAATGGSEEESTGKQNGKATGNVTGRQGSGTRLLMEYRQSFLNVDMMVINDLAELFMLIWSNGDEFTERNTYSYGYNGYGLSF